MLLVRSVVIVLAYQRPAPVGKDEMPAVWRNPRPLTRCSDRVEFWRISAKSCLYLKETISSQMTAISVSKPSALAGETGSVWEPAGWDLTDILLKDPARPPIVALSKRQPPCAEWTLVCHRRREDQDRAAAWVKDC